MLSASAFFCILVIGLVAFGPCPCRSLADSGGGGGRSSSSRLLLQSSAPPPPRPSPKPPSPPPPRSSPPNRPPPRSAPPKLAPPASSPRPSPARPPAPPPNPRPRVPFWPNLPDLPYNDYDSPPPAPPGPAPAANAFDGTTRLPCSIQGQTYTRYDPARFDAYTGYGNGTAAMPWSVTSLGVFDRSSTTTIRYDYCLRISTITQIPVTPPSCPSNLATAGLQEIRFMYKDIRSVDIGGQCGGPCKNACRASYGDIGTACDKRTLDDGAWVNDTRCAAGGACQRRSSVDCRCDVFMKSDAYLIPGVTKPFGAQIRTGSGIWLDVSTGMVWAATYAGVTIPAAQASALASGQNLTVCLNIYTSNRRFWGIDLTAVQLPNTTVTDSSGTNFAAYVIYLQMTLVARTASLSQPSTCAQQVCGDTFIHLDSCAISNVCGPGAPAKPVPCSWTRQNVGGCQRAAQSCQLPRASSFSAMIGFVRKNSVACSQCNPSNWANCGAGQSYIYCCTI